MDLGLIGYALWQIEKLEDLLSAEEKELFDRLEAFLCLYEKDADRAREVCAENNIQKNIILTPQSFLEEKPFSVFDDTRHKLISGTKGSLAKLENYQKYLYKVRMQAILRSKESNETEEVDRIGARIIEIEKLIEKDRATVRYLLLYPLIINHPKVSEDEKGQ